MAQVERGFVTAIRAEWEWRSSRSEPTDNLAAFEHLRPSATDTLKPGEDPGVS